MLWDTTLASRLRPHSEVLDYVIDQFADEMPVRVAAPALLEIAYGYQRMASGDRRYGELLAWLTRLLASETFSAVALDGRAALIAGRLRGVLPYPPARPDRRSKSVRDRRSKTMRQAAWLLDIEIAATAFAAGLDVATENRGDFEALADALAALFPRAPALGVVVGPL